MGQMSYASSMKKIFLTVKWPPLKWSLNQIDVTHNLKRNAPWFNAAQGQGQVNPVESYLITLIWTIYILPPKNAIFRGASLLRPGVQSIKIIITPISYCRAIKTSQFIDWHEQTLMCIHGQTDGQIGLLLSSQYKSQIGCALALANLPVLSNHTLRRNSSPHCI